VARTSILALLATVLALIATDQPVRTLSSDIVISQVYGGGGNSGAPYRNDFVELFNRGTTTVSLAGMSVQYASATGTGNFGGNPVTALSGSLAPGQYYLVQLAAGAIGVPLPTADVTGTATASGTAGKFALVTSTSGLACNGGSTPCSAAQLALIKDLVGWGSANSYEGAAAPATANATAAIRNGGGCAETDNNFADFTVAAPTPRNTASPLNVCTGPTNPAGTGAASPASVAAGDTTLLTVTVTPGTNPTSTGLAVAADLTSIGGGASQAFYNDATNGDVTAGDDVFSFLATVAAGTPAGAKTLAATISDAQSRSGAAQIALVVTQAPVPIHAIQGAGTTSPMVGSFVTTRGVVTARRFNNGFFLQTPDALTDADANTSEAIFVFTNSEPPAAAAVGAYVEVTGTVYEYVPTADPYSPPVTELTFPVVSAVSTPYPMPAAVSLTAAHLPPTGTLEQLEYLEAMRVGVPLLRVVAPTGGTVNETNATASSDGVFYGVIDGVSRPFREPGIQVPDPLPPGAPTTIPRFDFNPERLRVASWGQVGSSRIEVTSGALVSNMVGVLDYAYRTWTVLPDAGAPPAVSGLVSATPVPVPDANEFTVASFNMERFFDAANDPAISEPVLSAAAFERRLAKASIAIRSVMRSPDVLGVQEVENLSALQVLAAQLNIDTVANGDADPGYTAYLEEGDDPGGIDVGFLVKASRVTVVSVVQEGKTATFVNPQNGQPELLNDRPPLVLEALVQGPLGMLPVTVVVNHLRSLNEIDQDTCSPLPCVTDGPRVRAKRLAQAEFLATLIQNRQLANPGERIVSVGDYNAFQVNDGYVDVIGSVLGTPAPASDVVLAGSDLVSPDLVDLVEFPQVPAAQRYSYVFDGTAQVLDHVIANGPAALRVSRLHYARSNADFPESYRGDGTRPERLSDHDMPVAYFAFPGAPLLQLNGPNPMTVECCTGFTDPGATASDDDLGDLTQDITVTGSVDAHTVGSYALVDSVSNGYTTTTMTRTVDVVDTTPPVLTLIGANKMTVEVGSVFVDPGATASDTCAGDLTNWIAISGGVDASRVGRYEITYQVSDGYATSSATRVVHVVDTTPPVLSPIVPGASAL
jgi:hypothetical protein